MNEHASRPKPAEGLLLPLIPMLSAKRVLCTSLGRAQFASAFATAHPQASVACNFLDLYQATLAQQESDAAVGQGRVAITCEPDLPGGSFDLAVLPTSQNNDSELTRELLQQAFERLVMGGKLIASTDREADNWLREELSRFNKQVTRHRVNLPEPALSDDVASQPKGVVYSIVKASELKKVKQYDCEFAFRHDERLLHVTSRPGVFSHREVDTGARALIEMMKIAPGDRVFEIGCGSGAVSLAAATRAERTHVYAIDSNPRAVQCTRRGAELNGLANVQVQLQADGQCDVPGTYQVTLANPPYYSHYKIAEIFLAGAQAALKSGGRLYVVTKHPAWYHEQLPTMFNDVMTYDHRGYVIFTARKA